jgi:GAF domain-containing protein
VIKAKTPRYLEDVSITPPDDGPSLRRAVKRLGVKANACLPLLSKEDVIGVLYVDFTDAHRFSDSDKRFLKLFADQAAITIENARLHAQRAQDIAALQKINEAVVSEDSGEVLQLVVEEAVSRMPGEYAELWLYELGTGDLVLQAVTGPPEAKGAAEELGRLRAEDASINMRVAKSGETIICEDVRKECNFYPIYKEARSSVTVPLKYQHEVIGTINVESLQLAAFGRQNADLLESFADQAAIAIENARLLERLQEQRVRELETLSQLDEDLSAIEQEF